MFIALALVALIVLAYVCVIGWRTAKYVRIARRAKQVTNPFVALPDNAKKHIAILGDSSMYSAGATAAHLTIGGLMAEKYHNATIETLAVNGEQIKDLPAQFARKKFDRYDLLLIGVGGNDVVRFAKFSELGRRLDTFLAEASEAADQVVLCHSVNIGNIGFFPFPINRIFDMRTRKLSELYEKLAKEHPKVVYVNFYRPIHDDYYTKHTRAQFLAADGFHASDYANKFFFDLIYEKTLRK